MRQEPSPQHPHYHYLSVAVDGGGHPVCQQVVDQAGLHAFSSSSGSDGGQSTAEEGTGPWWTQYNKTSSQ